MRNPAVRILKLVSINVLVFIILMESMSVVVYSFKTHELFYKRNRARTSATRTMFVSSGPRGGTNPALAYQLHPYFGFVASQGYVKRPDSNSPVTLSYRVNNFGFLCPHNFPFKKTNKNQFIIGIFGGSVATFFSIYEREHHVLMNAIQRLPQFQNKEIIILNFAGAATNSRNSCSYSTTLFRWGKSWIWPLISMALMTSSSHLSIISLGLRCPCQIRMWSCRWSIWPTKTSPQKSSLCRWKFCSSRVN